MQSKGSMNWHGLGQQLFVNLILSILGNFQNSHVNVVMGGWRKLICRSIMVLTHHMLVWSDQEGWDGQGMWQIWGIREIHSGFLWGNLEEVNLLKIRGIDQVIIKVKVKQSYYRPGSFQISRQSAHEGGKVSPTHRPPLPPRRYSWYSFLLEAESTPGP